MSIRIEKKDLITGKKVVIYSSNNDIVVGYKTKDGVISNIYLESKDKSETLSLLDKVKLIIKKVFKV